MLNFLFGVLCAAGAVFGSWLAYGGYMEQTYPEVIAGGVFLFGSLLTFGVGQMTRSLAFLQKRLTRTRGPQRGEPVAFPARGEEPIIPHPVLERVASRFARPGR